MFFFNIYLNSAVDELTSVHSQPRQIHDSVRQGRALPPVEPFKSVTGPTGRSKPGRYKKTSGQQQQQAADLAISAPLR